jgi:16S rRNA (guanine527-N7)-methyltransferase
MGDHFNTLRNIYPAATKDQFQFIQTYLGLLRSWNRRVNLISRKDIDFLWEHHVLPSVIVLSLIEFSKSAMLLDIGSGGGMPAIPIKILRPDLDFLLVESIRKKALFLKLVISELSMQGISVIISRIEQLNSIIDYQKKFDLTTARAVAPIPQLFQWGIPFLKERGKHILWKGSKDIPELEKFSIQFQTGYKILEVPATLYSISPKFKELRIFVLESN